MSHPPPTTHVAGRWRRPVGIPSGRKRAGCRSLSESAIMAIRKKLVRRSVAATRWDGIDSHTTPIDSRPPTQSMASTMAENEGQSPPHDDLGGRPRREVPADANAWMKVAGLGIELAGTTLGAMAIGIGIDWIVGSDRPIATAIAALIGFAFAMFRFIQRANRSSKN